MFTPQGKEQICQTVYDHVSGSWEAPPYTPNWKQLDDETRQRILKKVNSYLDDPKNEKVLNQILTEQDFGAKLKLIEEFDKRLPYSLATNWEVAEAEKHPKPLWTHTVVSADKMSVTFYNDDEWAEYQKTLVE
jgi:hypothetical protein